jgi:hypothetical protein
LWTSIKGKLAFVIGCSGTTRVETGSYSSKSIFNDSSTSLRCADTSINTSSVSDVIMVFFMGIILEINKDTIFDLSGRNVTVSFP